MSFKLFSDDVLFFQRILRAEGLYLGALDGHWGAVTEASATKFLSKSEEIKQQFGTFDPRSEANIATLSTPAQKYARICLKTILNKGIHARILSGTRTYEEQNTLFRIGRYGNPGNTVTKAKGGESRHNFGIAWDIGIFTTEGGYLQDGQEYITAGNLGKSTYVEWGGDWVGFVDKPHFQLRLPITIKELRKRFEEGSLRY